MKRLCANLFYLTKGILGHLLLGISFLTFRDRRKYLCGCYTGFMDNPKYLFIELLEKKGYSTYWYSERKEEVKYVKSLGLPVVYCYSLKGMYHCLTAGNYVTSHNYHDYNEWTSGNVRLISLWHGVGPKNMYVEPPKFSFFKKCYNNIISHKPTINMALSTSDVITEFHAKSIGYTPDKAVYHTYPRCDFMLKPIDEIIATLKKIHDVASLQLIEELSAYKRVFLYMPTWRDNDSDFIASSGFDFDKLDRMLIEKEYCFLMKMHPNTKLDLKSLTQYKNIKLMDRTIDIYPVMPFTSVLVTDYSSIYYDYLLMPNKEVIFFTFDIEDYLKECRDFLLDFKEVTPGVHVDSFDKLYTLIESGKKCSFVDRERIIDIFWSKAKTPIIDELV